MSWSNFSPADVFAAGALVLAALDKVPKLTTSTAPPKPPSKPSTPATKPRGVVIMPAPLPTPATRPAPPPVVTPVPRPAPAAIPWPAAAMPVVKTETTPGRMVPVPTPWVKTTAHAVPQNEEAAVIARERSPLDASYWMYATRVTPEEQAYAKARLSQWVKDGAKGTQVWFTGPRTFAGRRQFRTARHGTKNAIEVLQPKPPFVHQPSSSVSVRTAAPAPAAAGKPTVRQGSRGAAVQQVQSKLGLKADGIFGPQTHAAVVAFQRSKGLKPDGIVGPATWAALG